MQVPIEQIIVNLIQNFMGLPDNYGTDANGNIIPCVSIASQNIKLFNTPELQITVKTISNQVYSNRKEYFDVTETINEQQVTKLCERINLNEQRVMQIDAYSRKNDALLRFNEIQMSLTSTLAEQLEDQYQFKIGKISQSYNLSGLDGGSDINRFTIRFNCISWQEIVKDVQYYDKYTITEQDHYDKINFRIDINK